MKKCLFIFLGINFCFSTIGQKPEERLKELGIELKIPTAPVANYVNVVRVGNTLYLSGKGPVKSDGSIGGFSGSINSSGREVKRKIRMLRKEGVEIRDNKVEDFDKVLFEF